MRNPPIDYSRDETMSDGSVVYWTQRERHTNSRGGSFYKVPIQCRLCGLIRAVQQSQHMLQRRRGLYTGTCKSCHGKILVPAVRIGPDSPQWKGGRTISRSGYPMVRLPAGDPLLCMVAPSHRNHPHGGAQILEHRLVMARHLGRPLQSWEVVHHRDGNKLNNALDNLELMTHEPTHVQITLLMERVRELERENASLRAALTQQHSPP